MPFQASRTQAIAPESIYSDLVVRKIREFISNIRWDYQDSIPHEIYLQDRTDKMDENLVAQLRYVALCREALEHSKSTPLLVKRIERLNYGLHHTTTSVPSFFRNTSFVTLALSIAILTFMFIDKFFAITPVGSVAYIISSLCCLSLYFTNKVAVREWKKSQWEQNRKSQPYFQFWIH